jgi:ribonuclease-3
MSRIRLHEALEAVFEARITPHELLSHEVFGIFLQTHDLQIPLRDLSLSFIHKSFSHEYQVPHLEQLEFLGDAVLGLLLTDEIFRRFPEHKEGQLSKLRSAIVNEKSLSILARGLCLNEFLIVGRGEYRKKLFEQDTVLADSFEALLAQIYRFHGLEFTRKKFLTWLLTYIPAAFDADFLEDFDAKSKLQEKVLARYKKLPKYTCETLRDSFEITLWVNEVEMARGVFSSKKTGEKELAQQVLKKGIL